jgi:hypothetical protein
MSAKLLSDDLRKVPHHANKSISSLTLPLTGGCTRLNVSAPKTRRRIGPGSQPNIPPGPDWLL